MRITPELAKELRMIPHVILGGQIFAGILFAFGLLLLCWLPAKWFLSLCRKKLNWETKLKVEECTFSGEKLKEAEPLRSKCIEEANTTHDSMLLKKLETIPMSTAITNAHTNVSLNTH